ncbi:MAG: alpha/beta hydrolase [Clostridiaceae bacterium]
MQKTVKIESRNLTLRGTLHIPENINEKVPVVVIFHGFCGNKMGPHFMFVKISRLLESIGIASVRFDFGGSGESDGEFIDMTITKEIEDANNILDYVKTLSFVDKDKVGILGFSMGGAIASIIAGDRSSEINTLCLLAPAGNMYDVIMSDYYIGNNYKKFRQDGYFEVEGLLVGTDFVDDVKKVKIYERASKYNKKSIIIHGDEDEVVSICASKKYLEIYGEKTQLKMINGANHLFDKKHWKEELIEHTTEYFIQELNRKSNFLTEISDKRVVSF